jgi:hypothetical protein
VQAEYKEINETDMKKPLPLQHPICVKVDFQHSCGRMQMPITNKCETRKKKGYFKNEAQV